LTIGFDLSDKSENILISYTKWILKWFAIVCVVIGVGIGCWIGHHAYQDQIVPMIAIKCERELEKPVYTLKQHYLVQKKRGKSLPYALYRPAHYNKTITQDVNPDDYWEQYPFDKISDWKGRPAYAFNPPSYDDRSGKQGHWIVRDNLQVIYWWKDKKSKDWKSTLTGKCRQITFDEFYAESERGLNVRKSKLKF
jgi:hypothetical protein